MVAMDAMKGISRQLKTRIFKLCKYFSLFAWIFIIVGFYRISTYSASRTLTMENVMDRDHEGSNITPPTSQFVPNKPKLVIVLGYQRVGSTFTGQLFNQNPAVFNMFEPIDGMYGDMYGTASGWNVPSDIHFDQNMSQRELPEWEKAYIESSVNSILTCNFNSTPMGVLTSRYFNTYRNSHIKLGNYIRCMKDAGIHQGYPKCREHIRQDCDKRFQITPKLSKCRDELVKAENGTSTNANFLKNEHCRQTYKSEMQVKCLPLLAKECENSSVRAIKTVRLSMELAGRVMSTQDNVRLIHLIRDPKAVTLSRRGDITYHGIKTNIVSEAKIYCQTLLRDIYARRSIEEKFPGTVMQIFTDTFLQEPKKGVAALYGFLQEDIPQQVINWVAEKDRYVNKTAEFLPKWHGKLQYKDVYDIDKACYQLYKTLQAPWPSSYVPE